MQNSPRYYKLEISRDKMKAYITLIEQEFLKVKNTGDGSSKDRIGENIVKEVKEIIKFGLLKDKLIKALDNEIYGEKFLIAKGINPIDGKDGYIKYKVQLDKKISPKINEDGTVNYRELDIINNVGEGDILAYLIPAEEGVNGYRVTGEEIGYKPGKPPYIKHGKNIQLIESEQALAAKTDGLVELRGNRLEVSKLLSLENVGKETGNIYFRGAVLIKNNALNGFRVIAEGDVEVHGVIEGAYIENQGNIIVRQGIQGYNRPTIKAAGDITTRFVENAVIDSRGSIIAEAIMHSEISCRKSINAIGKRGIIVGGICRAGQEIKAKTIGSSMATSTVLEVGIDPYALERKEGLQGELKVTKNNLDKIVQSLNLLENLKNARKLDREKIQMYLRLLKTQETLLAELNEKKIEYEKIEGEINNVSRGLVRVSDTVYPGVKIVIGNSTYFVRDEMHRCTFYREEGEIQIGAY